MAVSNLVTSTVINNKENGESKKSGTRSTKDFTPQFMIVNSWKFLTKNDQILFVKNVISCKLMILYLHFVAKIAAHIQKLIFDLILDHF